MMSDELLGTICIALENGNARLPHIDRVLRDTYPGIAFTVCSDNDVPSRIKPLAMRDDFALYGISTSGHCASLVSSLEAANGLTIALLDDE